MVAPKHVAIVMDGNGRWAQRRGYPRVFGHVRGCKKIKSIVLEAERLGVQALTLYAFSTENWSRPETEKQVLWKLLKKYLARNADELYRKNVRLEIIGDLERLDSDLREAICGAVSKFASNTGMWVTIAFSYGSRQELVRATQQIAKDCSNGLLNVDAVSEKVMEKYLWTSPLKDLTDVDLFIRTSGESRLSNFLLWQCAYAELLFTDVLWPDFEPIDLKAAIEEYSRRERRFGGLGSE